MASRLKEVKEIRTKGLDTKGVSIELQTRTDCFRIISRCIEAKNEEEVLLIKHIANEHGLDKNCNYTFLQEFPLNEKYEQIDSSIKNMELAIKEYLLEKGKTKIFQVRLSNEIMERLNREKNPSERVRQLIKEHYHLD